jgi:predicted dehydrogenase
VSDVDRKRASEVAERLSVQTFDPDALAESCDALIVAVTTTAHHSVARRALEAGCHVLVEKPLTPTLEEADDLIDTAERHRRFLAVGHIERFNAAIRACRPLLDDPRYISSQRLARFQPRGTDVPVMLDLMIHDIDLVLGLVDSRVASVDAVGVPVLTDSIDMANARIRFENGAVADISASRVANGEHLRRRADVDSAELWRTREAGDISLGDLVERIPVRGDDGEPLRLELEAFLDTLQGRGTGSVSAAEGRAALEVALRIQREIERSAYVVAQDSRRT